MPFKKGEVTSPKGRGKGNVNQTTRDARKMIVGIIDRNLDRVQMDLDSLEPFQRLQIIDKLLKYVVPSLTSTQLDLSKDVQDRFSNLFPFKLPDGPTE